MFTSDVLSLCSCSEGDAAVNAVFDASFGFLGDYDDEDEDEDDDEDPEHSEGLNATPVSQLGWSVSHKRPSISCSA